MITGYRLLRHTLCLCACMAILQTAQPASAQIITETEGLADQYPGKAYSPYAQRGFALRPLWGDTHLHTSNSMDAATTSRTARSRSG